MIRDSKNIVPATMAIALHVVVFGSMIVAFDYARPTPMTPLVVQATLVQEIPDTPPPRPVVEPEPEPEPVIEEPEPEPEPEPDNSAELRRQAEEEKRRQDALIEQKRLEELKKRERDEAERKKREEEEKERRRVEAERKRQEDIQRQREENERQRREEEAKQRAAELAAEERRSSARGSAEMAAYQFAIAQDVRQSWAVPASAGPETKCTVRLTQLPGGEVVGINSISCNSDDAAVERSVRAAIEKASPLPKPSNPDLFDRNLTLNLTLEREY